MQYFPLMTTTTIASQTRQAFNLDGCRSYATEAALVSTITKLGFDDLPRLICKNAEGRWTAVFFGTSSNGVIFKGFKWVQGFDSI